MNTDDSRFRILMKEMRAPNKATQLTNDVVSNRFKVFLKKWPWFYNFLREAIGPSHTLGSPYVLRRRVNRLLDGSNKNAIVLNLGSGTSRIHPRIINVDLFAFKNVDIVADISDMPFKDATVDAIVCDSVMEHVANSRKVLNEMFRILKPSGTLIVTFPFLYPYHSSPDDFYRWSEQGIRFTLKEHGFEVLELGMRGGPMGTLQGVLMHIFAMLFSFGSETIYFFMVQFFMVLLAPLKILDIFFRLFPFSIEIASDMYVIASKK